MLDRAKALGELLQLQADGVALPMPVQQILDIESQGGVVDLQTGQVSWGAADSDTFKLTEKGKERVKTER